MDDLAGFLPTRRSRVDPAAVGSPAEDGLRLLASLDADGGGPQPAARARVRE
ncbi:hypothetical protein [Streptomyces armeniacus]|uniref:hypothetical protein n=1 Tax=Streptomyces armeniacus TaxID=83291 RepID=UPI001C9B88D9|nr:hypothetical protein [Streptomyces armeniacus]